MAWLLDDCIELKSMENTHASHCGPTKSTLDFGSVENNSTHQCAWYRMISSLWSWRIRDDYEFTNVLNLSHAALMQCVPLVEDYLLLCFRCHSGHYLTSSNSSNCPLLAVHVASCIIFIWMGKWVWHHCKFTWFCCTIWNLFELVKLPPNAIS